MQHSNSSINIEQNIKKQITVKVFETLKAEAIKSSEINTMKYQKNIIYYHFIKTKPKES